MDIASLAQRISSRRGALGVRAAARDAGVSPATLSRVENGHIPDLETFEKICNWLGESPEKFLSVQQNFPLATIQFRKKSTITKETAYALSDVILKLQAMIDDEEGL